MFNTKNIITISQTIKAAVYG